jgi:hypothetical protein
VPRFFAHSRMPLLMPSSEHFLRTTSLLLCVLRRIYYSFDSLAVTILQLHVPLPVFFKGGGWTDCVLLLDGGSLRVMDNSRRDTLLLQRCTTTAQGSPSALS